MKRQGKAERRLVDERWTRVTLKRKEGEEGERAEGEGKCWAQGG